MILIADRALHLSPTGATTSPSIFIVSFMYPNNESVSAETGASWRRGWHNLHTQGVQAVLGL
jgi:hypothetical protein